MLGPFDDDDEDFCKPVAGSNLANVFNTRANAEAANESLVYVAPKQQTKSNDAAAQSTSTGAVPSESSSAGTKAQATTCLIAKIVTAFQLTNNETASKGKVGLALLKLTAFPDIHKLVLYTGLKKSITTATTSNKNVHVTLQANNYINMYDDAQQNWSMLFANQKDYTDFTAEIKKCKMKLVDDTSNSSKNIQNDDSLNNLEAITEQMNSRKSTDPEETDEKSKADLLKRMAKMGQAIIAPKQSSTSELTSDSSDSNDKSKSQTHKKSTKPSPAARKHVTIKTKEAPSEPSKVDPSPVSRPRSALLVGQNYRSGLVPSSFSNMSLCSHENVVNVGGVNYLYLNGQLIPVPLPEQTFPTLSQQNLVNPYSGTDPLSLLFAESRTLNSELRMNVNRMSDKMEKLMDKFDKIDMSSRASNIDFSAETEEMKITKLLPKLADVTNLSKLVKMRNDEVEKLKVENSALKSRLKVFEDAAASRERERLVKEAEFSKLNSQIRENETKLSQLEEFCEKIGDLKTENEELFDTIKLLEQQLNNIEKDNLESNTIIEDRNEEIDRLKAEIDDLSASKNNLNLELEKSKDQSKEQMDAKIKSIMNDLNTTLTDHFADNTRYSGEDVSTFISRTIKDTTIRILQQN